MSILWKDAGLRENENCTDTYAIFTLSSNYLDSINITELLKIQPDFIKSGNCSTEINSVFIDKQENIWALSSQRQIITTSSEKHLIFLLEKLERVQSQLIKLINHCSLTAVFHCYWINAGFLGGPVLSAEVMQRIANLHAYLRFEFI
ncbi:DUF4279 domain-containing protein [Scytonema hofmannii FACHB-248]|uniref:DUF4279 domain-containing protein n=1 Tax=Scytonema hofmannii FACHB-248 TaxID=1842502 RepID=A0ABR8GXJ5_9CYAN|nr:MULTISPECIES: DUF4279 domain-containing protein [Nostocales]MBD2607979.1 DUF4279 domain-containing protein [Scytonema hofmannii FACHB-248]